MSTVSAAIKREIKALVKELNEHAYRYYVLDAPVISDAEYDKRYRKLRDLEEQHHYLLPDSPTQRVGAPPLDKFKKVKHTEQMLSLDNAFSHDEVREFDGRVKKFLKSHREIEYTVEPKYDGLAMGALVASGELHPLELVEAAPEVVRVPHDDGRHALRPPLVDDHGTLVGS